MTRGGAVWQLVGLITRRSEVQILPPQPFGGIAQLARAFGSYPKCHVFESHCRYQRKAFKIWCFESFSLFCFWNKSTTATSWQLFSLSIIAHGWQFVNIVQLNLRFFEKLRAYMRIDICCCLVIRMPQQAHSRELVNPGFMEQRSCSQAVRPKRVFLYFTIYGFPDDKPTNKKSSRGITLFISLIAECVFHRHNWLFLAEAL